MKRKSAKTARCSQISKKSEVVAAMLESVILDESPQVAALAERVKYRDSAQLPSDAMSKAEERSDSPVAATSKTKTDMTPDARGKWRSLQEGCAIR